MHPRALRHLLCPPLHCSLLLAHSQVATPGHGWGGPGRRRRLRPCAGLLALNEMKGNGRVAVPAFLLVLRAAAAASIDPQFWGSMQAQGIAAYSY